MPFQLCPKLDRTKAAIGHLERRRAAPCGPAPHHAPRERFAYSAGVRSERFFIISSKLVHTPSAPCH